MCGERLARPSGGALLAAVAGGAGVATDTYRTAPFVERIQDVRFAELDPDRVAEVPSRSSARRTDRCRERPP